MRNQYIAYLFVFLLVFTGSVFADHPETETQTQENWNPPPGIVPDEIEGEEAVCAGGTAQYSCTGTDLDTKKTRSRSRTELPIYDEECPPNIIAWYWPDWPDWPPWSSVTNADRVHVIKWKASAGSITPAGSFTAPNEGGQYVTLTATLDDDAPAVVPPATGSRNDGIAHKTRRVAIIEVESVEADELVVGVGDEVTFTATTDFAGYEDLVTWSGGGEPVTDTGPTFTTKWAEPGEYTVTASCGTSSKSTNVVVLKVELDSVTSADFIGDETSGQKVYATSKGSGNVIFQLKTTPSGVALPSGFVSWTGGSAGSDQLQRILSADSLIESGAAITASVNSESVFNGLVYVFNGAPLAAAVNINIAVTDDPNATPFGLTTYTQAWSPTEIYNIYYENKKWKFVFYSVAYTITWGINSGGRRDVPDVFTNPFPLGMGMDTNSTEYVKKTQAKSDLTPDSVGIAPRTRYWASELTQRHELFHVTDWCDNYYTPNVYEAENWIESQEEGVTLSNLVPNDVLDTEKSLFHNKLIAETTAANNDFRPGAETRAYGDGKSSYQALADSIVP